MVSFTGSTEVGGYFLKYSADSNLKKVVLECGGKSPQIVLEDKVDRLDEIAEELAGPAFWNMGENCTCGSRILVHESLREAFVEKLAAQAATWTVGSPQDGATKIGALIEKAHMEKVLGYIGIGIAEGARLVAGGNRVLEESGGWFVEPTIFDGVTSDMRIAKEEIFGPVVAVMGFETEADAIALANDTDYGLAASVFTNDLNAAHRVARAVRAGTVAVNCYSEGDITTPFGGMNRSGFGGYDKVLEAFDQYTAVKTTWIALR